MANFCELVFWTQTENMKKDSGKYRNYDLRKDLEI